MMNTSGGIGNLVDNKVDAYRGQPERLEQSFQNNQQLIDLLALQKIKSEKEAAARQMQLDMAKKMGTPPTVAAQREKEVFDLTKNEIAQQSALGGQQIAAQQEEMKGIASQPAPNMARMATGGIVGFAEGGGVEDKESWLTKLARLVNESQGASVPLSAEEEYVQAMEAAKGATPEEKYIEAMGIPEVKEAPVVPTRGRNPFAEEPAAVAAVQSQPAAPAVTTPPAPATPAGGIAQLDTTASDAVKKQLEVDPNAAGIAAGERFKARMSNPEAEARRQSVQDRLEAEYTRQNDPKRQRREQLSAFLRAGAGRVGGIGTVLANASAGAAGVRSAQDAAKVKQLEDMQKYYDARVKDYQAMGLAQMDAEQKAVSDAISQYNVGVQGAVELSRQALQASEGAADRASAERRSSNEIAANQALRESLASIEIRGEVEKAAQLAGAKSREEYSRFVADLITEASADPTLMTAIMANPEQKDALVSDWVGKRAALFDVMAGTVQAR